MKRHSNGSPSLLVSSPVTESLMAMLLGSERRPKAIARMGQVVPEQTERRALVFDPSRQDPALEAPL